MSLLSVIAVVELAFHTLWCGQGFVLVLVQQGGAGRTEYQSGTSVLHSHFTLFDHPVLHTPPVKCPVRHWVIVVQRNRQVSILMDTAVKETDIKGTSPCCTNYYKL